VRPCTTKLVVSTFSFLLLSSSPIMIYHAPLMISVTITILSKCTSSPKGIVHVEEGRVSPCLLFSLLCLWRAGTCHRPQTAGSPPSTPPTTLDYYPSIELYFHHVPNLVTYEFGLCAACCSVAFNASSS
jgi:hypothetical protein